MTKEEFEKAFKILESHFSSTYQESEEVVNAYELWKSDYIKETMENFETKQRIDKAIAYNIIVSNSDYVYSQDEIANKNLSILQGKE